MNKVVLIGRLTRDPVISAVGTDLKTVAKFTLAVDRQYKNSQGEVETDFIPVTLWGKRAEIAGRYLAKGRLICITGRLQVRTYQDKEGFKRYYAEVIADNFQFLDSKEVI